ncbi:MAG: sugar phosphate isomerase/epimerase [Anaerolineae bacterium]|nr:sugar phosphate isomerase/epimerase [Anaerolineae bacterium]
MRLESAIKLSLAMQTPEVKHAVPVALLSGTLTEKLSKAAVWGADGVEIMSSDPDALDVPALKRSLADARLAAAAVGTGAVAGSTGLTLLHADAEVRRQARMRLYRLIQFADQVGAPVVTIGAFRGRAAWMGEGAEGELADGLRAAAELAAGYGLRLALEPVNRYEVDLIHTVDEGLDFLRRVGHDSLGLLIDTFHANIEESDRLDPYRRVLEAGRLFHVHLGDNNRLAPGWGVIDFRAIVACLRRGGYQGYLSAELLPRPDPDAAAQQTLRHMREAMGEE